MKVARRPEDLAREPRAVAIGTFDGVHLGHRHVIELLLETGRRPTLVTFHPHPRTVLGNRVELLTSLDRRLELLAELGVEDALVLDFTLELAQLTAEQFAEDFLRTIGAEIIVAGEWFRFGHGAKGNLDLLRELGFDARTVPGIAGVSSSGIRQLIGTGHVREAAAQLGRPVEVEGIVVLGDQRGGTLGYPTANLSVESGLVVPAFGIYAGAVGATRAAISIGTNPHYGGVERRIEAFLLDFSGDLYGRRLVVEMWERLREEQVFADEAALVAAIADDVARARQAERPG
jgi:riboflavin kinase/FMN adenylyltransferase